MLFVMVGFAATAQNPFTNMQVKQSQPIDLDDDQRTVISTVDAEIIGSLGIGGDTQANQAYGFDTMIMRENNLRILFDDTSTTGSFPGNDWRLTANDSGNGGANYFGIDDATGGTRPFRVDAGAGNNALYIENGGNVGLGNSNPAMELQVTDGDTSTLRLEQNGSSGFTPQSFDISANETNFFIRDATNGSALPFRIQPGSATDDALMIKNNGSIGIKPTGGGFAGINPNASIDLDETNKGLQLNRLTNAQRGTLATALGTGEVGVMVFDTEDSVTYTWTGTAWVAGGSTGTDDQTVDTFALNGNNLELSLEDDGVAVNTVDVSALLDNTDNQNISGSTFVGTDLTIGISGGTSQTLDLSTLDDSGTDDQIVDAFALNGNNLELSLEDDGVAVNTVDVSALFDNTDNQNISGSSFVGTDLTIGISGGTSETLDLSTLDDSGTDDQQLSLNTNSLDLEDGGSVDLSGYLDNTDDQNISGSGFAANMLTIGIEGGASETVDLSSLDNAGTDDQQLSLNVNSLDLEDGGSVDLSGYLDNTDNQNIAGSGLVGTDLTIGISGGTSETIDLSALNNSGTDDQQLSLTGNSLDLEDGGSVDLSGYLDNTDDQLLGFALNGNDLVLSITDGNVVTIDMTPLIQPLIDENAAQQVQIDGLEAENDAQQAQIDDLIARVIAIEDCACDGTLGVNDVTVAPESPRLFQNIPNPYDNTTSIGYFIPLDHQRASIVISTTTGQILRKIDITRFGEGEISVNRSRMASAMYLYTLYVDGKRIDTKRMLVE